MKMTMTEDCKLRDSEWRFLAANCGCRLWIHLHRWIFASAFVLLRPNNPNSRIPPPNSSKNKRSDYFHVGDNANTNTPALTHNDTNQPQHKKRGKQLLESIENEQSRKRLKTREFTDIPIPVRQPITTPNIGRIRRRVLGYLDAYGQPDFDEASALEGMENELSAVTPLLNEPRFPTIFAAVFAAWITYRYTVLAIKTDAAATPRQKLSEMDRKVKHMRLVTALRVARDDFVATGTEAMSADVAMATGIARLTNAGGADAGAFVDMVKRGFEKLDEGLAGLARAIGGLRGAKWVVMG